MKARSLLLMLALLAAAVPPRCAEPEITPQSTRAAEAASVRDRLMTSLFFRGELADMIISAGKAGMFVDVSGFETNAEVRGALIIWIQRNPEKAAGIYLHFKSGGAGIPTSIETYDISWKFNPQFMALVKSLNAAAGDKAVPGEALEEAESRLYGGPQAEPEAAAPVMAGGGGGARPSRGSAFFAYADYKLNKAGLERELAGAGAWLDAAKGPSGRGPEGLEKDYSDALGTYAAFVVAASSIKGRDVLSEGESRALEKGRSSLRARLAALALRVRAAQLGAAAGGLNAAGREPGAAELAAALAAAASRLEAAAEAAGTGALDLRDLSEVSLAAEKDFARVYLRYSAYNGLLALKKRAAGAGYSCFYDYALARYLARRFPGAAYARARAALAAGLPELDAALLKAGRGDTAGAFSGLGARAAELDDAARMVWRASALNRRAQFFLWGLLFRPVEWKVSAAGGRAAFRPAFTFFELIRKK
jgi:hypothetical protein